MPSSCGNFDVTEMTPSVPTKTVVSLRFAPWRADTTLSGQLAFFRIDHSIPNSVLSADVNLIAIEQAVDFTERPSSRSGSDGQESVAVRIKPDNLPTPVTSILFLISANDNRDIVSSSLSTLRPPRRSASPSR